MARQDSLAHAQVGRLAESGRVEATKNGEPGHVLLNETAFDALQSLRARLDGRLFLFEDGDCVTRAFGRAVKRPEFRISASMICATRSPLITPCRASRDVVSSALGHKDPRMTMHYWHLSDGYLRAAVNGST